MMSATSKILIRLIDLGRITVVQISETAKWLPFKDEVVEELRRRGEVTEQWHM